MAKRYVLLAVALATGAGAGSALEESCGSGPGHSEELLPRNLARTARIEADSEYSTEYKARFVADGAVAAAGSHADRGGAWAVQGETHRGGATLSFTWDEPVSVGEIVYYGRVAWFLDECWKTCEVRLDDDPAPLVTAHLARRAGPQRIELPEARRARRLRVVFTASYGGFNPGAAEIQIFPARLTKAAWSRVLEEDRRRADPHWSRDRELAERPGSKALAKAWESGGLGFSSLVLVQRRAIRPSHVYTYHNEGFRPGGGLCRLSPGGEEGRLETIVPAPTGQILDCDVDFDGGEILFSWKQAPEDTYHVWKVRPDGSGLVKLTEGPAYDFNACWLPDGGIAFLSTRRPAFAYCWTSPVGILHRMERDGSGVRQISANYLNDFTPSVTNDGRLIYGRWEYVDRPAIPIQSLWTIRPDGTGLEAFFGNRVLSPATFIEPRSIPGRRGVLCTLTAHNGPCRGAIGIIDPVHGDNAQASIRNLTPEVDIGKVDKGSGNQVRGPYESPFPLDAELFLVSRTGTLLLRDVEGTRQIVLRRPTGDLGLYSAQPLRPRRRPPIVPDTGARSATSLVEATGDAGAPPAGADGQRWATVFVQDVYRGLEPLVKRGEIERIAVVQEIEKGKMAETRYRAFGFQFPVVSCGATYAPKKVWGYAPVAADGSACFRVPAGVPIYFMALDRWGRARQRMRSFTHLRPGEVRGCVGCHEPRTEASPAGTPPLAVRRGPVELEPPEWGVRGFDYASIVQPVLDRHCAQCHDGDAPAGEVDLSGDRTDYFCVSYETLAREGPPGKNPYTSWIPTYNGQEANILRIAPGDWGSPASRLADLVLAGHPDRAGRRRVRLTEREARRVLSWIDLNVPYYGTSLSNHYHRTGCRQMVPPDLDRVLGEVAGRRCRSCHRKGGAAPERIPRKPWVRIERPWLNPFLRAPLARSAGGTEACGEAVFASDEDPDYRAILKTFDPITRLMRTSPRVDMVASRAGPGN